jgi:hypothetical protein
MMRFVRRARVVSGVGIIARDVAVLLGIVALLALASCRNEVEAEPQNASVIEQAQPTPAESAANVQPPASNFPNLQAEIMDDRFKTPNSEIGQFDFRNFTYPLPRGWQHPEVKEITLGNGKVKPVAANVDEEMSNEAKAEAKAQRRIGMSYVTTRFMDVTGDGKDEAVVILKVETRGNAIPQLVYVYEWKDGAPSLIWNFRTGDRADGGLKDIRVENGLVTLELYGQDRFVLGEVETGKITGDEEQLCCPTFFTRSNYKWNGNNFLLQPKRLTYKVADPDAKPLENFGDIMNDPIKSKKYLEQGRKPYR